MEPRLRILVIDDEAPMLRAIERLLRGHDFEVLLARDPASALETIATRGVDVVVSDQMMPTMTGLALLEQTKAHDARIVRVLMSGSIDRDVALRAVRDGNIERFIEKPWPPGELQRVLLDIADERISGPRG